ncbi:hypothetical protein ACFV6E_38875 [Streptomyces sp. NPDC059785]|uniref:hypothetical protein n=1 Tax=unclassified Streptomyces TaxID=2593676 RepID=UPI00365CC687
MKRDHAVRRKSRGSLALDIQRREWSARITEAIDPAGAALLLSLPRGLFVAHDGEMRRVGAWNGDAIPTDLDYLTGVWGFTRLRGDELAEIAEVPLVSVRVDEQAFSVHLSGYPWLLGGGSWTVPAQWTVPGGGSCLLGICFDTDLGMSDADDYFWSDLAEGKAVLGQVKVGPGL